MIHFRQYFHTSCIFSIHFIHTNVAIIGKMRKKHIHHQLRTVFRLYLFFIPSSNKISHIYTLCISARKYMELVLSLIVFHKIELQAHFPGEIVGIIKNIRNKRIIELLDIFTEQLLWLSTRV